MVGLGKTIASILWIVSFLALISLASFLYNTDQKKQEELANSELAKKSQTFWESLSETSNKNSENPVLENNSNNETSSVLSKLSEVIKEEWENSQQSENVRLIDLNNLLSYQKTIVGGELSLNLGINKVYTLPLPFKFWQQF